MTLKEFYAAIDGSYDEAIRRLMSDKFILKYLGKFADAGDCAAALEAVRAGDWASVFSHTHNLKGVCLNLELGCLSRSASALCDAVRSGAPTGDIPAMTKQLEEDYALVTAKIKELLANAG
jgi:HPt (histidine-containing phosphotransfer) domain-containing protein